ncbi:hypothetical protein AB0E62_31715 [Streptomyces sp. NPDC038707]|uniref:hypothetical protein n=1 Tax=unclassified Streptomyces TaxID=2593676 RepID=UPI0033CF317B
MRSSLRRAVSATAAVLSVGSLAAFGTTSVAAADTPSVSTSAQALVDITCTLGVQVTKFNPGLTFVPQQVDFTVSGTLGGCVSLTNPQIVGGTFSGAGQGVLSCTAGSSTSRNTIRWNTGQSSVVESEFVVNVKPDGTTVLVSEGSVVGGLFQGSTVVQTRALPNTDLTACAEPGGLQATSGAVTTTILL